LKIARARNTDIMGRFGGEEFIYMLPECTVEKAAELARDLRKRINSLAFKYEVPIAPDKNQRLEESSDDLPCVERYFQITVSLGITSIQLDDTYESMIKRADDALYHAKETGRNRLIYTADGVTFENVTEK
jgi:PleD family two-component response regulator